MAAVARNGHGLAEEVALTPQERAREALVMGLRLGEGVNLSALAQRCGVAEDGLIASKGEAQLLDLGLIARTNGRLRVTPAGMPLLDRVLAEIVAV
jgi:oxygen-independent coproporphyrinogen-3 oxidase